MATVLVKKKAKEESKEKKPQVRRDRFSVTDPNCVTIREAIGAKWGAIGKDHIEKSIAEALNEHKDYKDKIKFGFNDAANILSVISKVYQEAAKTASAVLLAEGSDIQTVTVWTPVTSSNVKLLGARTQYDVSILRQINERKEELIAAGATEEEIAADQEIAALQEQYLASKQVIQNEGVAKMSFKSFKIIDGKTEQEIAQEKRNEI